MGMKVVMVALVCGCVVLPAQENRGGEEGENPPRCTQEQFHRYAMGLVAKGDKQFLEWDDVTTRIENGDRQLELEKGEWQQSMLEHYCEEAGKLKQD